MKKVRKHFCFYGNVQGVGFRSRARWMASGLGLTGWVKNEWDGSVEMEVQGDPAAIAKLLEQLKRMSYAWMDRMQLHGYGCYQGERLPCEMSHWGRS